MNESRDEICGWIESSLSCLEAAMSVSCFEKLDQCCCGSGGRKGGLTVALGGWIGWLRQIAYSRKRSGMLHRGKSVHPGSQLSAAVGRLRPANLAHTLTAHSSISLDPAASMRSAGGCSLGHGLTLELGNTHCDAG